MLFFFELPAPKTGSWAQQSTSVVVYDNQVYYVYYIKMASNDLSNNYSIIFLSIPTIEEQFRKLGLQIGRKKPNTHTHTRKRN